MLYTINSFSLRSLFLSVSIFITLILGIIWQGGELFWFGPAVFSSLTLLVYSVYKSFHQHLILPRSSLTLVLIAFTAWCFITIIWSGAVNVSLLKAIIIASAMIGFYSYFLLTSALISWEKIWLSVIAAGFVLFIYSCIELYIGIKVPNSLFFNQNTHSAYLNLIILPTTAYFLISTHKKYKILLGASLFVLVMSHTFPGSRGATLGQLIGFGMIFLTGYQYINKKAARQFLLIYLSAVALATLLTSNLFRFVQYKIEDIDNGRWEIWEGALNLLSNTPWYGSGIGTYWLTHPAFRHINDPSSGQNPHNDYLQYLIETGVPGLALLLLLMATIIVSWWIYIHRKDGDTNKKIEASGLIGAIAAIGFHSFFSYNLGVYAILFLTGILLGRFIHLTGKTFETHFLLFLPIKKSIFNLSLGVFWLIALLYFSSISAFSYFYIQAGTAYNNHKITEADRLNSIAISILPQNERPYILYAQLFISILDNIDELTHKGRLFYYNKTIDYLQQAYILNPYREQIPFLQARLIEKNTSFTTEDWANKVSELYLKALKINPRHLLATQSLARFYQKQQNIQQASLTIYHALKYWQPANNTTLKFYNFALQIINQSGNKEHLALLTLKKNALLLSYEKRGKAVPDELKNY